MVKDKAVIVRRRGGNVARSGRDRRELEDSADNQKFG